MTITTILKAAQASDFLAAIPALLGFQPTDSAVVVPFRGFRTNGAMRFDLPAGDNAENFASVAAGLVCKLDGVTGLAIVVYGTDEQAEPVSAALTAQAALCGLDVIDALYVTGTEWARIGEKTTTPLGEVPAHIAAMATEASAQSGAVIPEVDDALTAEVAGSFPDELAMAVAATGEGVIDVFEQALSFDVAEGNAAQAATLIAMLALPILRDVALIQWARGIDTAQEALTAQLDWRAGAEFPAHLGAIIIGEGDRPDAERLSAALSVCRHLAALAPEAAKVAPLVASAWLSWALGRSTHADVYVRQALAIDPEHGMSRLLAQMVSAGRLPEWAFSR